MPTFHDFSSTTIHGDEQSLAHFAGKVVLTVNVASECGYTPQYTGLEKLYRELKDQSFAVLACPCNQFGAQEPGDESSIKAFCATHYDVTFPITKKIEVNGPNRHPLYAWLTSKEAGFPGDITWNFEKFLIGREGRVLGRYPPGTPPEDAVLLQDIVDALE